ncbi:uncharacterized protein LOC135428463 [Drosophila montana]|uniref:uncharacterized protein LOC135428463 n=1 Tax=Drosophila montana TaxID=40370 RepID=UPI00313E1759
MSAEEAEEAPAITADTSKFTPIIFTNAPEQAEEHSLSIGREKLKKWLGRVVRVTLKNKLVLIGIFSCTDHDQNLIIANCDTFMPDDHEPIAYGNVVVPGDQIQSFAVDMPLNLELELGVEATELQETERTENGD